jgi:DNA polymerase III sliding clamp (beta) subunit (PCNA family)
MILKTTVGELLEVIDSVWETTDVKKSAISSKILLKGISKADESWLYLYATNYDTQCLGKIEVELDEDFMMVVDPDDLTKAIRSVNHEVVVKLDITKQVLTAGKLKHKVPMSNLTGSHEASMKNIPVLGKEEASLRPLAISTGITAAGFAVAKSPSVYGVTRTMELKSKGNLMTFSATDGNVAAVTEVTMTSKEKSEDLFTLSLSREHLAVFKRLLGLNQAGTVSVHSEDPTRLFFKFHNILFGTAKSIGKLPDIKKLIDNYKVVATGKVPTKELKEIVRRIALFTNQASYSHGISLTCETDKLIISTVDSEDTITGTFSNKGSAIVRKDYLIECLSSCRGQDLSINFVVDNRALIVKDSFTDEEISVASSYILMGMGK